MGDDNPFDIGLDTSSSPFDVGSPDISDVVDQLPGNLYPTYTSAGDFGPLAIPLPGGSIATSSGVNQPSATTAALTNIGTGVTNILRSLFGGSAVASQAVQNAAGQQAAVRNTANTQNIQSALLLGGGGLLLVTAIMALKN